jgi:hypothetical protein
MANNLDDTLCEKKMKMKKYIKELDLLKMSNLTDYNKLRSKIMIKFTNEIKNEEILCNDTHKTEFVKKQFIPHTSEINISNDFLTESYFSNPTVFGNYCTEFTGSLFNKMLFISIEFDVKRDYNSIDLYISNKLKIKPKINLSLNSDHIEETDNNIKKIYNFITNSIDINKEQYMLCHFVADINNLISIMKKA